MATAKKTTKPSGARYNTVKASPTCEEIIAARGELTQTAAAELIYSTLRSWQDWEYGNRPMHPGLFELFQIKRMGIGRNRQHEDD